MLIEANLGKKFKFKYLQLLGKKFSFNYIFITLVLPFVFSNKTLLQKSL